MIPFPVEAPEPEPTEDRRRRSHSQLEGYLRCGEAFRLERIAKAPQTPAAWLTQGVAFHEAIELWEKTGRAYNGNQADEWYREAWGRMLAEQLESEPDTAKWQTGGRTRGDVDIERRYEKGRGQVADYVAFALAGSEVWRPLELAPDEYAVELPFDMTLNGVRIIGFIDQVIEFRDGGLIARDLKTGNKLPTSPRQLGVYRVALGIEYGLALDFGDYYMCKNQGPTEAYDLTRYTPERVGGWFTDLDESVAAGRFIPNPGDHCRICSVAAFCDLLGPRANEYPTNREEESI